MSLLFILDVVLPLLRKSWQSSFMPSSTLPSMTLANTSTDRLRASHLGSRLPLNTKGHPHNPQRRCRHHPRGRHLLGELHAAPPRQPLLPERQHLPSAHCRRSRHLAAADAHDRLRGAHLRAQRKSVREAEGSAALDSGA